MLSVVNVTTGSSGTANEANKSVDTRRPSRCSDLQGSRAPLNPYQLSLPAATLLQMVLSSDKIHESPRQKTRFDGNGLLRRERRWRGRLVRTSHYSFRQHLTKHGLAAVSLSARLCHTNAAGLKAPPYLHLPPNQMGNLCGKQSKDPFAGQGRTLGSAQPPPQRTTAPVPTQPRESQGRTVGGMERSSDDPRAAAARAAEVRRPTHPSPPPMTTRVWF